MNLFQKIGIFLIASGTTIMLGLCWYFVAKMFLSGQKEISIALCGGLLILFGLIFALNHD